MVPSIGSVTYWLCREIELNGVESDWLAGTDLVRSFTPLQLDVFNVMSTFRTTPAGAAQNLRWLKYLPFPFSSNKLSCSSPWVL